MKRVITLLLVPMMLFSYSFKESMTNKNMDPQKLDAANEMWTELGLPTSCESKEAFHDSVLEWLSDENNQAKFVHMLRSSAKQGGLESFHEFYEAVQHIENTLKQLHKAYCSGKKKIHLSKSHSFDHLSYLACRLYDEPVVDGETAAARIQELRDEEKQHKEAATEYMIQAGVESLNAGAAALTGMEFLAVVEVVQSSRHLVKGCGEYMESVECKQDAEALEEKYFPKDEDESKSWWQFWK